VSAPEKAPPREIKSLSVWKEAFFRAIQGRAAAEGYVRHEEEILLSAVKIAYLADAAVDAACAEHAEATGRGRKESK
jgi:hypothetical protein